MEPVEIRTDRLHLRGWRPSDAPAVLAACTDPLVQAWTSLPAPYTAENARQYVEELAPASWAGDAAYPFAVTDRATGDVLANVALRPSPVHQTHDVGYWASAGARDRGVTSEALSALCRWGFADVGATRIEWYARVGNFASRRVAEKAGFTIEGTLRSGLPVAGGRRADAWVGARLPGDPEVDTRRLPAYPPLTDGVVTLRPWRLEDADDVRRACDDPLTAQYLPVPSPYTYDDGVFFVGTLVPMHWADGIAANVAVTDAATGGLLGAVGLRLDLRQHGVGEVGYWTAPWARGRGIAGRAGALHAQWGFDVLALNRVELLADVDNSASQRAAEKGGFGREGVSRRSRPDRTGEARDMALFARTR
jgi:RimJ/RimL family protein N-acetyltransferase